MKLFTILCTCILSMMLLTATVVAQDVELTIKKASVAPVIDGEMDAIWEGAELQDEFNVVGEDIREDTYDMEPSFRAMWDNTYLYFWIDVVDDSLSVDESYEDLTNFESGSMGWADDVVEIYIDGDGSRSAAWADELDGSQLWWLPKWPGILYYQDNRLNIDTTNIVYAKTIWDGGDSGWSLEVAIPLEDAGIAGVAGTVFGFEFDVGDDDGVPFDYRPDGPGGRDLKLKWFGTSDVTEPVNWAGAELSSEEITVSAINENSITVINSFQLDENYPNPFNPVTQISYSLPATSTIQINVYDLLGHQVASLVDATQNAGTHTVAFDASALSSGVYFYSLITGNRVITRKMTVLK
jgi:hypothetical protein